MPDPLPFLGEIALRSSLVLALAFVGLLAMSRASASQRHLVLLLALLITALLPAGLLLSPKVTWHISLPQQAENTPPPQPITAERLPGSETISSVNAPSVTESPFSLADFCTPANGVIALLPCGMVVQVIMLGRAIWVWRRIRRHAKEAVLPEAVLNQARAFTGSRPMPPVFTSDRISVPLLSGWRRPAILLPADSVTWPARNLLMALCHELAHFLRGDSSLLPLLCLLRVLYWWHPLVWLALARLRRERESACDDLVLNQNVRATDYAELIIDAARRAHEFRWPNGSLAMASSSNVSARIAAILNPTLNRRASSRATIITGLVLTLVLGWFIAAAQVQAEAQPSASSSTSDVKAPKPQVDLSFTVVEINETTYQHQAAAIDEAIKNGNLAFLINLRGASALQCPSVTTPAGTKAKISIGKVLVQGDKSIPVTTLTATSVVDKNGKVIPRVVKSETPGPSKMPLGMDFETTPSIAKDGTIHLPIRYRVGYVPGYKGPDDFYTRTSTTDQKLDVADSQATGFWVNAEGKAGSMLFSYSLMQIINSPGDEEIKTLPPLSPLPNRLAVIVHARQVTTGADASPNDSTRNSAATVPTQTVLLHVQDASGQPISGANLKPERLTADGGATYLHQEWSTSTNPDSWPRQTDAQGNVEIRYPTQLDQGGQTGFLTLAVEHAGFATQEASINLNHLLPVTLAPAAKITVHMIPPAGVTWAREYCQISQEYSQAPTVFTWTSVTPPGTLQTFAGPGTYQIRPVAFDANEQAYFAPSQTVHVASVKDMPVNFAMSIASDLGGVLDASVPRPVKQGTVQVVVSEYSASHNLPPVNWSSSAAITEDGSFVVRNLPPGLREIVAFCPGYVSRSSESPDNILASATRAQLLDERPGQPVVFPMEATGSAQLQVLTPDAKPLPNAVVSFYPVELFHSYGTTLGGYLEGEEFQTGISPAKLWRPGPFQGTTDAKGMVTIAGLPRGNQRVWVKSDLYAMPYDLFATPAATVHQVNQNILVSVLPGDVTKTQIKMTPKTAAQGSYVQFHIALVNVDEATYQRNAPAMDEAVREGNLHFFDNPKDGWIIRTVVVNLLPGQPGWYSEGTVQSYIQSAKQEVRNGQPYTTLQANSVFLGLNADFSWSKDRRTIDTAFQITEPVSYKPLSDKKMQAGTISSTDLPEEQFHVTTYTDKGWDMTPGKQHAFWVGQNFGVFRHTSIPMDEMIKARTPSRLAAFLTAQTADN